jgi:hypothetical protein
MFPLPKQRSDQGAANVTDEDIPLPFDEPAFARKRVSAALKAATASDQLSAKGALSKQRSET